MKRIPNRANRTVAAKGRSRGYTLLELLIVLVILVTVTGAVFEQINGMQKKAGSEAMKLDMNQQAREFLDQTVRDLHMAGYPGASMYSNPTAASIPGGGRTGKGFTHGDSAGRRREQ